MLKVPLLLGLFIVGFILQSCNSSTSENLQSKIETNVSPQSAETLQEQETKIHLTSTGKAEFRGVSFNYNPQIFGGVEIGEITKDQPLEHETDKPGEDFPKHLEFHLKQINSTSNSINKGRIVVIPIENYRQMYAVSNDLVKAFDDNLKQLQKVLLNKNFRDNGEIPFMPFYDAHQQFLAKVEHIPFQNGKSLCFLTQYAQEDYIINNEHITYYCQGITDDKRNYVLAVFPVNVSFLPKDYYVNEFEDYHLPETTWNMNKNEEKQYKNYISKITQRLDNLPSDKYEPNLNYFGEIISSLKIEN